MPRGRIPAPTELKILRGNPGRRPLPTDEPRSAPAASDEPPYRLTKAARAVWDELAPRIRAMGCLGDVDRRALASACRLEALGDHYATIAEQDTARRVKRPSPALWAAVKLWDKAAAVFYRFGVTPSSRAALATKPGAPRPAGETDPLEALRQKHRGGA